MIVGYDLPIIFFQNEGIIFNKSAIDTIDDISHVGHLKKANP